MSRDLPAKSMRAWLLRSSMQHEFEVISGPLPCQRGRKRGGELLALLSRTFTFELSLAGSPRADVEYDYVGKQSIPTTGLSPASPTALWAAEQSLKPLRSSATGCGRPYRMPRRDRDRPRSLQESALSDPGRGHHT
jgi:hypothetical protein